MDDVVIIGGGVSSLAAAVDLALSGAKVILIEQTTKLGGRCYSYRDQKTGDVVDNGQHVLLGAYHNTLRYLRQVGTLEFLHTEPTLKLPLHHPTKGFADFTIADLPRPFDLSVGMLKFKLLPLSDRRKLLIVGLALKQTIEVMEKTLVNLTINEWLTNLSQSRAARQTLWDPIAISVMNEDPSKASALLFARSLRAAFLGSKEDSAILIPTIGQTDLYVTGAERILKDHRATVRLNSEVVRIEYNGKMASSVILKDGSVIRGKHVLSTVPWYALTSILPSKMLEEAPFTNLHRIESTPIISLHLWFDQEFMEMDYVGVIGRKLQWIFNRRAIVREENNNGGYISTVISGAREVIQLSREKLMALALHDIHAVFPKSRKAKLLHTVVIKEKRATFSATPEIERLRPTTETRIPNFFLAGDWTATKLPATIEGAILSGYKAATAIKASKD